MLGILRWFRGVNKKWGLSENCIILVVFFARTAQYTKWSFLPAGDTETWAVFHAVAPLSVPPLNSTSLHQSLCCCTTTNLQNLKASTWEELSWKNAFQSMHVKLTVYFALSLVECHPRHLMWDPTCRLYFETILPTIAQGFPTVNRNK